MVNVQGEVSRFRTLRGVTGIGIKLLLCAIPLVGVFFILDVPFYLGLAIMREQYLGTFLGMVLGGAFLLVPATRGAPRERVPWYDVILCILGFVVGLYIAFLYPRILVKLGTITPDRVILSTIAILLVLEAVRRLTGWLLISLGIFFIFYSRFTWLFPGMFYGRGIPWDQLSNYLLLDPNSLIGIPLAVTGVIVLAYIFFGNLLFATGGGQFLMDLSMATMGRFRGGPAKVAVLASSLFGTVTGAAVANVATTGVITIPLMKKTGYQPHMAGAIEAVASTGGQFMPPIMGAAAFIMADFLGLPYREVVTAAVLPAILYYVGVFVQVDLEARKAGLRGLAPEELPRLGQAVRRGWLFIIPVSVLVYTLFILALEPGKAGVIGALSILLLSQFERRTRFHGAWLVEALEGTGRAVLEIGVLVAVAGFIIGSISITGMGVVIPMFLSHLAGENAILLVFVVAVASIILGMGLPTIQLYILLAVLLAPAMIMLGINPMAAHLFILYFGMLSMITPPICFAAYAAASIAGSDSMRTGYAGMRLGIIAYIVPFLFVFSPALLLMGSWIEIILTTITAVAGCFLLGITVTGYLFRKVNWLKRSLMALAGIGLLIPGQIATVGLASDIIGTILGAALLLWEWQWNLRQ